MKAALPCPVNPKQRARFENDLRSYVNYEAYFFSDSRAKKKFDKQPWKWSGRVTDPVTRERFVPTKKSPQTVHAGRPYFFRSDSTRTVFLADAERYAKPKTMAQMKAMADAAKGGAAKPDSAASPAAQPAAH